MTTKLDYRPYFMTKTRSDGNRFVCLTDTAPDDLKNLIFDIHHLDNFDGCLSNDWVYDQIENAFNELFENDFDNIRLEPSPYYCVLFKWLYENPFASAFCDEYLEYSENEKKISDIISGGQLLAMDCIYRAVADFLEQKGVE